MFIKRDYNLKFGPRHDESPGEVLKFTMFKQQDTFRKQVCELHQAKLDDTILQSHIGPFSCYTEPVQVPVEKTFCPIPVANAEHRGILTGTQQKFSSPQGCFSQYTSDKGGNPLVKGYYCCSSRQPTETNNFLHDEAAAFSLEEVDLSLSIGRNNQKEGGSNKAWDRVIDSKESNKTCTNAGVKTLSALGSAAHAAYFGDKHDLKSNSSLTNGLSRNLSKGNQISHSSVNFSTSFLQQNFFNEGVKQCYEEHISESKPAMGKPFPFLDGALLDLNIPLLDESSFHPNNVGGLVSSSNKRLSLESHRSFGESHKGTSCIAVNWREQKDDCSSSKTSASLKQSPFSCITVACCDGADNSMNLDRTSNCGGVTSKMELKGAGLTLEFQNGNDMGVDMAAVKGKKDVEMQFLDKCKGQDALEDMDIDRSPVSGKSISDSENLSSITKEPETHLRNSSSEAFQNTDSSHVAKPTGQRDVKSSDNSDTRFQMWADLKGKAAEVDNHTQEGASNLIYFMSECIREQCYTVEAGKPNKREHERNLQPECSDSFEANVLKLTECSVDDCCVSSEPFEVNNTHKKDYGITLRRGRRMKDFRKDILPSLASLSRHEISEDMHLMETILRSREYKKNRSKMKGRENQFKTVRNRRSR